MIDWFASEPIQSQVVAAARPGAWNDPDMIIIGNFALSVDQAKSHLAIWCMMAAPLLMSNDLRAITPEMRAVLMNSEVIAVDQDPLGKQGMRVKHDKVFEWWTRPLVNNSYAVTIWLRADDQGHPQRVTTRYRTDLNLPFSLGKIRDLFARRDVGIVRDQFTVTVNPLGVVMLRITDCDRSPCA